MGDDLLDDILNESVESAIGNASAIVVPEDGHCPPYLIADGIFDPGDYSGEDFGIEGVVVAFSCNGAAARDAGIGDELFITWHKSGQQVSTKIVNKQPDDGGWTRFMLHKQD